MKLQNPIKLYLFIFTLLTIGMILLFIYNLISETTFFINNNTMTDNYVFISTRDATNISNISESVNNVSKTIENIISENSSNTIIPNTDSVDSSSNIKQLYIILGCAVGIIVLGGVVYLISKTFFPTTDPTNIANNIFNVANTANTNVSDAMLNFRNKTENIELLTIVRNSNDTSIFL